MAKRIVPFGSRVPRARKSGRYIRFTVDMSDINVEQRTLKKNLTWGLANDIKPWAKKVEGNVKDRFKSRWEDTKSRRLDVILKSIKSRSGISPKREVYIGVGKIDELDSRTVISRLDTAFPQYHITPFLKKRIKKKTGQPSKASYHLWRILENRYSPHQKISGNMSFTTRHDGYSQFHFTRRVTNWQLSDKYFNRRFYFLTSQRTIYDEDKKLIYRLFSGLAKKQIYKTRFSPRLSHRFGGMKVRSGQI